MQKSLTLPSFLNFSKAPARSVRANILKQEVNTFWLYAGYVLAIVNVVVLFSYLLGINAAASTGYEMKKIQQKISILEEENKKLNLQVSEKSSIAGIQADFSGSGFVPVGQAKYLQVKSFSQR